MHIVYGIPAPHEIHREAVVPYVNYVVLTNVNYVFNHSQREREEFHPAKTYRCTTKFDRKTPVPERISRRKKPSGSEEIFNVFFDVVAS